MANALSENYLNAARKHFNEAERLVSETLKLEVLAVLNSPENKHITAFVMAMGSAFFVVKNEHSELFIDDEDDAALSTVDENDDYILDKDYKELVTPVFKILREWNEVFKLTGIPIRYDRDHVTGEWIETNDW